MGFYNIYTKPAKIPNQSVNTAHSIPGIRVILFSIPAPIFHLKEGLGSGERFSGSLSRFLNGRVDLFLSVQIDPYIESQTQQHDSSTCNCFEHEGLTGYTINDQARSNLS